MTNLNRKELLIVHENANAIKALIEEIYPSMPSLDSARSKVLKAYKFYGETKRLEGYIRDVAYSYSIEDLSPDCKLRKSTALHDDLVNDMGKAITPWSRFWWRLTGRVW